ncbi:MAG: YIP1 family protein [Rhodobacteraceae bacterium]|nr:YIP1 family protein [Paracoccaceae bacterium]
MAVSTDIIATWRRPGRVMRKLLSMGRREDRALVILVAACLLIFVAQMPFLARLAELDPSIPLDARIQSALYAWIFLVPVFAYVLGLVLFGLLRLFGRKISAYATRLGLFWTLLAIAPASLFFGLCRGFLGDTGGTGVAGVIVIVGFFWILIQSLREAMSGAHDV